MSRYVLASVKIAHYDSVQIKQKHAYTATHTYTQPHTHTHTHGQHPQAKRARVEQELGSRITELDAKLKALAESSAKTEAELRKALASKTDAYEAAREVRARACLCVRVVCECSAE